MAQLNEMTEELEALKAETPDDDSPEDKVLTDLIDGITLLRQSQTLLSFIVDPDLCKGITNRERTNISRFLTKIKGYLEEMEMEYEE